MVDTRALGRQPGSMRTAQRVVPAPSALAVGTASVPEGSELSLDFRMEAVMEGVLVTGTVEAVYQGECARCLDAVAHAFDAGFQELFRYPDEDFRGRPEEPADDGDGEEDYYLEGDLLDLEQVVRDATVLALPLSPLCQDDCPGLCAECGVKLAEAGADHGHGERVDPRWEALRKLGGPSGDA
ncbi:YceD family protein [Nocardiopsis coralliicola]